MKDEKQFLHDLASPITVVNMNLEFASDQLRKQIPVEPSELLELIDVCIRNIGKAGDLISARRELLKKN